MACLCRPVYVHERAGQQLFKFDFLSHSEISEGISSSPGIKSMVHPNMAFQIPCAEPFKGSLRKIIINCLIYVGGTVAGIHGELTHIEKGPGGVQGSWGLQESMFFGVRSNTPEKVGADGSAKSVMSWGFQIPTLGRFGYFESDYDFSNQGLKKANDEALMEAFSVVVEDKEKNEAIIAARAAVDKQRNVTKNYYSKEVMSIIQKGLSAAGFVIVEHMGAHGDGTTKITYRKTGGYIISGYGNIEFCVRKDGSAYSSYNYGNRYFTHLILDMWGYEKRGYR